MLKKENYDDDDDEEDQKDDVELIKEENKSEYDLQLSLSENLGILFKTHKQFAE